MMSSFYALSAYQYSNRINSLTQPRYLSTMLARAVLPKRSGSLAVAFLRTSTATILPPKQLQGQSRTLQFGSYRQSTVFYRAMSTALKPEERAG